MDIRHQSVVMADIYMLTQKAYKKTSKIHSYAVLKHCLNFFLTERAYEKKKTNRETEDAATRKSEITLLKSEVL